MALFVPYVADQRNRCWEALPGEAEEERIIARFHDVARGDQDTIGLRVAAQVR